MDELVVAGTADSPSNDEIDFARFMEILNEPNNDQDSLKAPHERDDMETNTSVVTSPADGFNTSSYDSTAGEQCYGTSPSSSDTFTTAPEEQNCHTSMDSNSIHHGDVLSFEPIQVPLTDTAIDMNWHQYPSDNSLIAVDSRDTDSHNSNLDMNCGPSHPTHRASHGCSARQIVDLTEECSSDDEIQMGSSYIEPASIPYSLNCNVSRKLPDWTKDSRKQDSRKASKSRDWQSIHMPMKNPINDNLTRQQHLRMVPDPKFPSINQVQGSNYGLGDDLMVMQPQDDCKILHEPDLSDRVPKIEPFPLDNGFLNNHNQQWNGWNASSFQQPQLLHNSNGTDVKPDFQESNQWCNVEEFEAKGSIEQRRQLPQAFAHTGHMNPMFQPLQYLKDSEKRTYEAALMDLHQPTAEATPDHGLLGVPLLKHQRIALAWMVDKEKRNRCCCGGILADDQGLGKTISTISLILKERPQKSVQGDSRRVKPEEYTVNLDEEDEVDSYDKDDVQTAKKHRPSAGTLIVCPTSVLRQWAQEIRDKVTQKAGLTHLVYHGSSRTKDPEELAKHDVVLTTYSIVSQEVPKQEDSEELEEPEDAGLSSAFTKKPQKKSSDSKKKKNAKSNPKNDVDLPLARVNWFRVVLDEAQTIKNHRTKVSRACWSLRAKRRWCLSGTPIQNSIDDLYSYFRFLRFDPYSSYKIFCAHIKWPISKNPIGGYKKLQVILRTIMLRRTKATFIDGEPIINLPPKTITLNKIDFSEEEREFYCRLEADSRAQFKEYADQGTVKQNYVNILLMLLRLRQACDHPLLVKNSTAKNWKSSLKAVRKLPIEKQIDLKNALEDSVALCGICNDAPEEAVISLCNHIFCNQCIADHFAQRDDTVCPAQSCKKNIKEDSVYSYNALKHCLLHDSDSNYDDTLDLRKDHKVYSSFDNSSFGSSKIKAALEALEAIPKTGASCLSITNGSEDSGVHIKEEDFEEKPGNFLRFIGSDAQPPLKKQALERPEKAIVFSQWTSMLDLLEAQLRQANMQYRRLDGTMSVLARDKAVNDFKTLPEVTVMIMSLKAASLGLNMVAACHVILLDLWWNPTTEDQAIDRAHRIGQTRPVNVSRFTVKDTVEDRILALQERKREMVASAFGEDASGRRSSRLTEEDLHYLFKF